MICIPVSVKHHTCAQPNQATNSVRSSASALLKRTVATGEGAGRWALRSFSVLYAGGIFLNPGGYIALSFFNKFLPSEVDVHPRK